MKTVIKPVYYCDHCKKRSLSKGHMNKHEKGCTANPDRECGMCGSKANIRPIVEDFKSRFELTSTAPNGPMEFESIDSHVWTGNPISLLEVRGAVGNCPCCILAILRQTGLGTHYFAETDLVGFEFQKEKAEWFRNDDDSQDAYW